MTRTTQGLMGLRELKAMTTRYVVRDIPTEGCDFLVWGDDDLAAAVVSLCHCHLDGIGHDVELVWMPAEAMDEHTRRLIEGPSSKHGWIAR